MKKEIIEHIKNLGKQGTNIKISEDQINDLVNAILDKKDEKDKKDKKDEKYENLKLYIRNFFRKLDKISISYGENKLSTGEIDSTLKKYIDGLIGYNDLIKEYNKFIINSEKFKDVIKKKKKVLLPLTKKNG